jgi:hypothetical protein
LTSHHSPYAHELLRYPDAGHGVGTLLPFQPLTPLPQSAGRTPEANELALAKAWPEAIAFVLQHSR